MQKPNYSIAITGEWPGAGQTTTAKVLAQSLHMDRVYAGLLFRKFAYVWSTIKHNTTWKQFESKIQSNQIDLSSIPFQENQFSQTDLQIFQQGIDKSEDPSFWDITIDSQSLKALQEPGNVVEAKIGIVLDQISILPQKKVSHRIFKFLLRCPPEITATRIIKRKLQTGELKQSELDKKQYDQFIQTTINELQTIHLADWKRYNQFYHIKRQSLFDNNIIQIDTSNKQVQKVVAEIKKYLP